MAFYQLAFSQIYSNPEFPLATEPITIYFDATGSGLEGYTGNVYAHTGVTIDGTQWQFVIGSWGNNTTQPQLTKISTDYYSLEITPSANDFYGVGSTDTITELCIVFRSADGSQQSSDLFLPIYTLSNNVTIASPETDFIYSVGDSVEIQAVAMFADTMKLYIGDTLHTVVDSTVLFVKVPALVEGNTFFTVTGRNETDYDTVTSSFFVRRENIIEEIPVGCTYGINYINDNTVTLVLYAPNKEFIFLKGDFNDWEVSLDYQMKITPDNSTFWLTLTGLTAHEEYAFQYYVDGEFSIADPYTDKVLDPWNDQYISNTTYPNLKPYPDGGDGIVSVFQTAQTPYSWQITNFDRPASENLIVYELHIRDFIATHDYQTMIDTINYLKILGINAIELMPINEFEGNSSWGYNPSFYFAPDKYYGPKDKLKEFIDVCHQNGIAVILDIVFNHSYGQSPLVQLYLDRTTWLVTPDNPWYNVESPNPTYSWGYDFNHESPATVYFVDRSITYWLTDYKVDGFRFDFTKGFTNNPGEGWTYDQDRIDILDHYYDVTQTVAPGSYLILEHLTENSEEKALANYGLMLWGNLNYSYAQASMGYSDGWDFSWISYQNRGWDNPQVVGYMESHDEERMMFRNLEYGNSTNEYDITDFNTALKRVELAANFFITIPGPKMIWQFEELGYDISIDEPCRICEKPIHWEYYENIYRNRVYKVFAALIDLKKNYEVFNTNNFTLNTNNAVKQIILEGETMDAVIVGNFGLNYSTITPSFTETGTWYEFYTHTEQEAGQSISLAPGEYKLFTTQQLSEPDIPTLSSAPEITTISISGDLFLFDTLTANYTFFDSNEDLEGESTYQWYFSDYSNGQGKTKIDSATAISLIPMQECFGKYVAIQITPVAQSEELSTGNPKMSSFVGPIIFDGEEITIYPNPFVDIVNFINTSDYNEIIITDISGKVIFQKDLYTENIISVNLQGTKEGVYLVKLSNDISETKRKIIKMPY